MKIKAKLIYAYTTNAHEEINTELYSGNPSLVVSKFESLLNDVLEKIPIHIGTVLRDYTPKIPVQEYLKEFSDLVGTEKLKVFKGFLSTSKNPKHNWNLAVKFNIQSKTGRLIENISSHAPEQEVLFPSMSAFKVLKVEGNTIYLEEF